MSDLNQYRAGPPQRSLESDYGDVSSRSAKHVSADTRTVVQDVGCCPEGPEDSAWGFNHDLYSVLEKYEIKVLSAQHVPGSSDRKLTASLSTSLPAKRNCSEEIPTLAAALAPSGSRISKAVLNVPIASLCYHQTRP